MKELLCIIIISSIISYCCYRCSKYYVVEKFKVPCKSCKIDTTPKCSTCTNNHTKYECKSCMIDEFEYKTPKKLKKYDTSKLSKFNNNILVPDIMTYNTKYFENKTKLTI